MTALPAALEARLRAAGAGFAHRPFRAATPSFRDFDSDELGACRRGAAFPAFSITGGACALMCEHCRARILEPMIPTGEPAAFEALVRGMIARQGMRGFLLSGGSNRRNEVPFDRYLPVVERLKRDHPTLEVLVHTGLVDSVRARALANAGVDVAMLDIIGDEATVRDVYHLDRPVEDFALSLRALREAGLDVVPHIVAGLHFGQMRGEWRALEMIAAQPTRAAILVVVMPAVAGFPTPDALEVAAFMADARAALSDRLLLLGCARPPGAARVLLDEAAVLAGFDGIAFPADEAVQLARELGRATDHARACCGTRGCA